MTPQPDSAINAPESLLPLREMVSVGAIEPEWEEAFAPTPAPEQINENAPTRSGSLKYQEKWVHNKDRTWRGYYVERSFGITKEGRRGKLAKHIKGSRILDRNTPKGTRGGRKKVEDETT